LVDHFRAPMASPLTLWTPAGEPLQARAGCSLATGLALGGSEAPEAAHPPPATPRPAVAPCAARPRAGLRALDTGDAQMRAVITKLRKVQDRPIAVLIGGETGTGKEWLARAIHADSARAAKPFVAVNCAAIPETLIESELFGYEEGAFTGARRKGAVGKIVHADGGTLFLDEIGDMPLALQARLLRVLQDRQVTPLGGHRSVPVDVAIVSASHRDLRAMIRERTFREDLYYRLNGLAVTLPPLRERSDLPVLVERMLAETGADPAPRLAAELMQRFGSLCWPGNLRQLHSVLQTAAAMAAGESTITAAHLADDVLEALAESQQADDDGPAGCEPVPAEAAKDPEATTWHEAELVMIRRAVAEADGNISAAAKRLGIARNTIYRKLRGGAAAG
jgi:transcriptional regulator with PAS, ATPase and Fis domain